MINPQKKFSLNSKNSLIIKISILISKKTKNFNTHGKNLGKDIEKKMIASDLILCLTKNSFAHSKERLKSEKKE